MTRIQASDDFTYIKKEKLGFLELRTFNN